MVLDGYVRQPHEGPRVRDQSAHHELNPDCGRLSGTSRRCRPRRAARDLRVPSMVEAVLLSRDVRAHDSHERRGIIDGDAQG